MCQSERAPLPVDTDEYSDATNGRGLVVIAMHATSPESGQAGVWGAFRATYDEVAGVLGCGDITFLTCDMVANPVIAMLEGIGSVPSVVIYRDGRRTGTHVGAMSAARLVSLLADEMEKLVMEKLVGSD